MKKGISLIALIITIIVIIILAVITIFGVNGVIEKAREAKILQEISNEKEIVSAATIQAKKEINSFNEETLGKAMNNITGVGETYVFADSDNLAVQFKNSERYYLVNKDGVIEGPVYPIEDEYAGDITKNGKYDGSEEKPYQINCIEDLVVFSIMTNGGNIELGIKRDNFNDKYVELVRNLDFNSIFSYNDYKTNKYGDLNKDTFEDNIQTELTKKGEDCIGFTQILFNGIFDGKGNTIKNLYMRAENGYLALFGGRIKEIKNLEITGEIINTSWGASGIYTGDGADYVISNCKNYANITGYNFAGGIILSLGNNSRIRNCENYGTITLTGYSWCNRGGGGIYGACGVKNAIIENCKNFGDGYGTNDYLGGIGGSIYNSLIDSCINYGDGWKGGIVGNGCSDDSGLAAEVRNCVNVGKCNTGIIFNFGLDGGWGISNVNINNCYNLGVVVDAGIGPKADTFIISEGDSNLNISNCYSAYSGTSLITSVKEKNGLNMQVVDVYYNTSTATSTEMPREGIIGLTDEEMRNQKTVLDTGKTFVEILNENIGENEDWKQWTVGTNGYPVFVNED